LLRGNHECANVTKGESYCLAVCDLIHWSGEQEKCTAVHWELVSRYHHHHRQGQWTRSRKCRSTWVVLGTFPQWTRILDLERHRWIMIMYEQDWLWQDWTLPFFFRSPPRHENIFGHILWPLLFSYNSVG
jgi:hypothetical protein